MARSGEEILNSLFDRAIANGLITKKYEQGRLGILFSTLASELSTWEATTEDFIEEMNLVTAQDERLIEDLSAPFHTRQYESQSAVTLKFSRITPLDDILIPIGTQVETPGSDPIQYFTIEEKTLYEGDDSVEVRAYSNDQGTASMVGPDELNVLVTKITNLTVTNPEESWGAQDRERIDITRYAALSARYTFEKGSEIAIKEALRVYGLESYKYNIVDQNYGYGSFTVFVDTTNSAIIEDIQNILEQQKGEGIYATCEYSTPVEYDFDFTITIASNKDLLPNERDQLKVDFSEAFTNYVTVNGVGKNFVKTQAIHFMYEQLLEVYELSDISLEIDNYPEKQDEHGNILLDQNEVIKISTLNISTQVG